MLDNSTGNRIQSGKDTGFVVSEDGALTDVLTGYGNLANATGAAWTIGKNDVANGFADLSGNGTVLATSKTQFIVVTGTGTDTLDVKIYDGMAEFLGSSDWVSINLDDTNNESFTYYLTEADLYNRYNTEDNKQVAKVIVDARDVTWTGSSNVYYSAPGAKKITNLNLAGNPDAANIEPFELWNNGVKGVYWIDKSAARTAAGIGSPSAGVAITDPGTANTGDFYNLVQINTVHGTPIYKAVKAAASPTKSDQPKMNTLANGGVCNGDLSYPSTPSTPSDPTYDVTAPAGSVGGAINLDKTTAKKGDTVTVTATPEPGYMLVGGVTVKDANGKVVETNRTGKGVYTFAMPGSKVTVDAVFKPIFTDITAGDYYDAILWAAETALTTGDNADGTTFGPGKECMRRDIVTFLWRAAGQPDVAVTDRFTDVPANAYYAKAVAWAVANNITNGVGDGTRFDPDAPCTRAQVVTFLHRSHKEPLPGGVSTFTDVGESYYTTAVSWAVENGITKGVNAAGTLFAPDSTCTRAQIVTFLYRDMEK